MGHDKIPTYEQVKAMKYAKAVLHETLRLYPTAPNFTRACVNDEILPNGMLIKAGWNITWNHGLLGRLVKNWGPDSAEFKPERFLTGNQFNTSKFTAFHGGPRACLGKTLAELQGVFVLASILKQFEFEVVDPSNVKIQLSLTLPMKNGLFCKFRPRSK